MDYVPRSGLTTPPDPRLARLAEDIERLAAPCDQTAPYLGTDAVPANKLPQSPPGYELIRKLGYGGMGDVYLAREHSTERTVAIKFLRSAGNPISVERFLIEVKALAKVEHPNIVRILATDFEHHPPYFTMEVVSGGKLSDRVAENGPYDPREAAELVATLARGLAAAHAAGVLHRDLKPNNILLAADGTPKVADFGLAKLTDRDDELTPSTGAIGTPGYMPPEQVSRRHGESGEPSDVYGLGATLYFLLTGHPPFDGPSNLDVLHSVERDPVVRPRAIRPDVPMGLEAIAVKCLEKKQADRYQSATELAEDLDRWVAGGSQQARPLTRWRRASRWTARHQLQIVGTILTVFGTVAAGAALAWRPKPADPLDEIRTELQAGRAVALIGATGLPRYSRTLLEPNAVGESSLGDKTCGFTAHHYCLLELAPDLGLDRYRIDVELCHVRANIVRADNPDTDWVGLYFGYTTGETMDGSKTHAMYAVVYKDYILAGRPAHAPSTSSAVLRTIGLVQSPSKLLEDTPARLAAVPFSPGPNRPGPWRPISVEIGPDDIRVVWRSDTGEPVNLVLPPKKTAASAYRELASRLDALVPGGGGNAVWTPRSAFGVASFRSAVAIRNLVITPLP